MLMWRKSSQNRHHHHNDDNPHFQKQQQQQNEREVRYGSSIIHTSRHTQSKRKRKGLLLLLWKYSREILGLLICFFFITASLSVTKKPYQQQPSHDNYHKKGESMKKKSSLNAIYPRHLGCYFEYRDDYYFREDNASSKTMHVSRSVIEGVERLKVYWNRYPSKRMIEEDEEHIEYIKDKLYDSKKYRYSLRDPEYLSDICSSQYEWQKSSHPNCNSVHEIDLFTPSYQLPTTNTEDPTSTGELFYRKRLREKNKERMRLLTNGYWRDVWKILNDYNDQYFALKTLRLIHDFDDRNYDRHRRDAVAMERLSKSPLIVDIYAYCSNTALHPISSRGDLNDLLWPRSPDKDNEISSSNLLKIAMDITSGIHVMHTIDHPHKPSMAHTDITTSQFIYIDGTFQLNDFNRVRFLSKRNDNGKICPYRIGRNPGKFRSPEEYEHEDQSEKVDIYSLGNVFFVLLTKEFPFEDMKETKAKKLIKAGKRPQLPLLVQNSTDPIIQTMIQAMNMCWAHDPSDRPSAKEIYTLLQTEQNKMGMDHK